MRFIKQLNYKHFIFLFSTLVTSNTFAQGDIEDLLYQEVDNLNPVYKPVIGFGAGYFNFLGDVKDTEPNYLSGNLGYKLNVATFVDNQHYIRSNFYFIGGSMSGGMSSATNLENNLNFKTDALIFGVNLNYDFDNFFKVYRKVHPFISVGFETVAFSSKVDSLTTYEGNTVRYHYWDDGTIRTSPKTNTVADEAVPKITRDYVYETDLRDNDWGNGTDYPQYSFAIPIDVGVDFWITDRVMFRVGSSFHLALSDVMDHVAKENNIGPEDNGRNDHFLYTYATMHLDLFSSRKTLTVQRLFADVEFDRTLMGDEDTDGYFDGWDECPGTPFGVETDTLGCPLDDDYDGVPNYLDDEPHSRYGAFVDERGVEYPEEELIALLDMSSAVRREDIELFIRTPSSYENYRKAVSKEIPQKFFKVDSNDDGYISFDEILDSIDDFFDFNSNLNTDDIYELNNFFFEQ